MVIVSRINTGKKIDDWSSQIYSKIKDDFQVVLLRHVSWDTLKLINVIKVSHSRDCWRKYKWPSIKRNVSDFQHLSFNFYPRKNDTTRFYRHSGKVLISFSILVAQIRKRTHSRKTSVFRWKNGDKFNRRLTRYCCELGMEGHLEFPTVSWRGRIFVYQIKWLLLFVAFSRIHD